jgi:arsenate reductase
MQARIWHNPRCSKSRAALALLEQRSLGLEIIDYVRNPPTPGALRELVAKLGCRVADLVRTDEPEYRAFIANGGQPTDAALLDLLAREPRLLQRPIVEIGERAVIGRPPERVLDILP